MHLEMTKCRKPPWVTLTLTSDLVSRICIASGAYLLYSLRQEFIICCVNASWDDGVSRTILGSLTLTLTSDLVFRIIVSGADSLYYLR